MVQESGIGNLTSDAVYDAIKTGVVEALGVEHTLSLHNAIKDGVAEALDPDEYGFAVEDAIKQGVFDAFAGLLVNSHHDDPRADLLLSVERGVQEAFEKIGTTADAPKRSKPYMGDQGEPE